uniref:Uncharacterized protein n=1 Tax=Amicula sp. isolate GU52X-4 cfCalB7 TaxID=3003489 RepID=A0A9E8YZ66_9STRA|nr:hypothetical protein [Amicula sp. isolate GU52X-4 cfCalB7]
MRRFLFKGLIRIPFILTFIGVFIYSYQRSGKFRQSVLSALVAVSVLSGGRFIPPALANEVEVSNVETSPTGRVIPNRRQSGQVGGRVLKSGQGSGNPGYPGGDGSSDPSGDDDEICPVEGLKLPNDGGSVQDFKELVDWLKNQKQLLEEECEDQENTGSLKTKINKKKLSKKNQKSINSGKAKSPHSKEVKNTKGPKGSSSKSSTSSKRKSKSYKKKQLMNNSSSSKQKKRKKNTTIYDVKAGTLPTLEPSQFPQANIPTQQLTTKSKVQIQVEQAIAENEKPQNLDQTTELSKVAKQAQAYLQALKTKAENRTKTQMAGFLLEDGVTVDIDKCLAEINRRAQLLNRSDFKCSKETFIALATEQGDVFSNTAREAISLKQAEIEGHYKNPRRENYGQPRGLDAVIESKNYTHAEAKNPVGSEILANFYENQTITKQGRDIGRKFIYQQKYWSNPKKYSQLDGINMSAYFPAKPEHVLGVIDLLDVPAHEKAILEESIRKGAKNSSHLIFLNNK